MKLIATATMGLESIVGTELKNLGIEHQVENGRVLFDGDFHTIAKTNLWLRTADRVKILLGEKKVFTFEDLFQFVKSIEWEEFLPVDANFPVTGKAVDSQLMSVPDCQAITKKAIVDRLSNVYKLSTRLPETGPLFKIEVAIHKNLASITIDTSGEGLHKRGYRSEQGVAPLKETLAAALVLLTNWRPDMPFEDPFCGSGTIPIEAALIGQNIAPGFNRSFLSETWPISPKKVWDTARQEVEDKAKYDTELEILGSDIDHRMIEQSKENAERVGLGEVITFKQRRFLDVVLNEQKGVLISNPPYGERMGEKEQVTQLYRDMGNLFRKYPSWSIYIITSNADFERLYGQEATKKRKLYNGNIRTDYYQFWAKR